MLIIVACADIYIADRNKCMYIHIIECKYIMLHAYIIYGYLRLFYKTLSVIIMLYIYIYHYIFPMVYYYF